MSYPTPTVDIFIFHLSLTDIRLKFVQRYKRSTKPDKIKHSRLAFNMEINNTTIGVYRMCRLYGFAPYKIIKNKRDQIIVLKLNWPLCVYGILLMIFFILSIEYAFLKYLYLESLPR